MFFFLLFSSNYAAVAETEAFVHVSLKISIYRDERYKKK